MRSPRNARAAPVVSAAFFVSRRLFGSPARSYVVSISRETCRAEYCSRNGKAAFNIGLNEREKPY